MFRTLKGKITVVYVGLVLLIAAVGTVSVLNLMHLGRSVNGLMTRNYRSISQASGMREALDSQDKAILAYMTLDETAGLSDFYAADRLFGQYYDTGAHNVTEPGEQAVIDRIRTDHGNLDQQFAALVAAKGRGGLPAAKNFYDGTISPTLADMKAQIGRLVTINQNAMFRSKNTASADAGASTYFMLGLSLLAVLGGFFLSRYFVNRFLRPVRQLTEGIRKVQAGEFDLRLDIHTSDETGRLAMEFNDMIERLSVYEKSTMGTLLSERNKSVAIVRSISDPLVVLDGNFRIRLLNHASEELFSIEENRAGGRHFLEAIPHGDLFDRISQSAESRQPRSETILRFADGRYYNVVISPIFETDGRISGYILLLQDVTRLKELEQVKTDFLANVSHEFKTPLTSVIMGASMLADGSLGRLTGEQAEVVHTIAEDSDRLSSFVTDLLEISRIEAGKSLFDFRPCSIAAIAESACRQFREPAASRGIRLQNELGEDLPRVTADFEKITWVLNNLIGNAVKFSDSGGAVTIRARRAEDMVEVSVADTGEGIPPDSLDRIFDRFVRVSRGGHEVPGTGLGLAIAREIVTAHHGRIWAESRLHAGSVFTFTLPVCPETPAGRDE